MPPISPNSYINKKRQSNARKAAAAVARHRRPAFQVHRDPSAQSPPSARPPPSTTMLQERDSNTNVTLKRRRGRPSRESAQSMPSAKQRKTAQQMEIAGQNHEDRSDIRKLQDRWEETRERHQRYCERATRLNRSSPSPLPATPEGLRSASIQSLISRRYELCIDCGLSRALSDFPFRDLIDSLALCVYCIDTSDLPENEMRWCLGGNHNALRSTFRRVNGLESSRCAACRPVSPDPTPSPHATPNQTLDASAVSEDDWNLIHGFYSALENFERDGCDICNEVGFDMKLTDWEGRRSCHRCTKDRSVNPDGPTLWSAENGMDPLCLPTNLPELSLAEEMLIARAHVTMEFRRVKGHQYKYTGHVVNFVQNTPKIVSRLPSLPSELQVLLLKPATSATEDSNANRQFERTFRVRRRNVEVWLTFLREHHPDYANIVIDAERLSQLPQENSILDRLPCILQNENDEETVTEQGPNQDAQVLAEGPTVIDTAFVPDLTTELSELAQLRTELEQPEPAAAASRAQQAPFSMATLGSRPLNERDPSLHIARMAFPTLFPIGAASFNSARLRAVTSLADYHNHLMRYKDGRFARHPQFRYWAFNSQLRKQVCQTSRWYTSRSAEEMNDINVLREMVEDSESRLADMIVRKAATVRGTRPYWNRARTELEAMVYDLACPSLFFTLSAADLQWRDLYAYMPDREVYITASEGERVKIAWRLLQENPHIAAECLERRVKLFLKLVMKKKFKVQDIWYRFEWQSRGSGHIHGFLWIDDAPSVTDLDQYLSFWGVRVTAFNPAGELPAAAVHPSSRPFSERTNTLRELTELLNRFQRHTRCTPSYCQRKIRGTDELTCRFHFPRSERPLPEVSCEVNSNHRVYLPARNDALLNSYNAMVTMGWMANTDISPCTDQTAVVHYLAKYCSKAEKKSEPFKSLLQSVMPRVSDRAPLLSLATKLMNKLIAERDWSAQEVCHHLLQRELRSSSRAVQDLDLRPIEKQRRALDLQNGRATVSKTFLEHYCERPAHQEHLTLLVAAREYTWINKTQNFRPRRDRFKVINLFPRYSGQSSHASFPDFCRAKLMLHHCFRSVTLEDLLNDDDEDWVSAYAACAANHDHSRDPLGAVLEAVEADSETESLEHDETEQDQDLRHEELLSRRRPNHDGSPVQVLTDLGERSMDKDHDWLQPTCDATLTVIRNHSAVARVTREDASAPATLEEAGSLSLLNAEQRDVVDRVIDHYRYRSDAQPLLHLDGVAGTGKSTCINLISSHLAYYAAQVDMVNPVLRAAPTGVAAFNIKGFTLHQLLNLPIQSAFEPLKPERLTRLQDRFRHCRLLIIDEKSMIGLKALHYVDQRLRQIYARPNDFFGGLSILFCGDFGQLPPVSDRALYNPHVTSPSTEALAGLQAYLAFDQTVVLSQIMRQQGEDAESRQFRETLNELRDGKLSPENWGFLLTRVKGNMVSESWTGFDEALHLYATRHEVDEYNFDCLERLNQPVIKICAKHAGKGAKKASSDEAGKLSRTLLLSRGARVMLTFNMSTEEGLVNGSMGTVLDVLWDDGIDDPFTTLPAVVLVEVDGYVGSISMLVNGRNVVSIFPRTAQWNNGGNTCSREQFPLVLAFAITIHKSQGLTLAKVVLNLAMPDFCQGLTYVGLSRVRRIQDLAFNIPFSYDRFFRRNDESIFKAINDSRRRQGLSPLPFFFPNANV